MITPMLKRWTGALCALAGCALAPHALSSPLYSVLDLGTLTDLPNRADSRPNGINIHGDVAGANVVSGSYHALLYNGSWTNLGTLGGSEAIAAALNDLDRVVGYSTTGSGFKHAFQWTAGSTGGVPGNPQMKDLGTLGGNESEAYGINGAGQITGYAQTASDEHAFRYSSGIMTDIGALLGSKLPESFGYGINSAGHVAGTAYDANYKTASAFFYNGSTAVKIGNSGGGSSSALAINDTDHIAGYASTSNTPDHAFRYFNGVMTSLGTLGGHYSYGIGINNSNVVVGGSFIDSSDSVYHAFIATGNSMVDLNNQLDSTGTGWTLIEARAINDAGQIVGIGALGGVHHTFLLNPVASVSAPTITGVRISGSDVIITFPTRASATYLLQARTNLVLGVWREAVGGIPGTGGAVSVTNAGAANLPEQFYRLGVVPP